MTIVGAGIILTMLGPNEPRYLLLKGTGSNIWSFPKGHPEDADRGSVLRTAVRETFEETGFLAGIDYDIIGNSVRFGKRPYWIGIMRPEHCIVSLCQREHSDFGWFTWSEIETMNTANTDVRTWVKKSQNHVGNFMRQMASALQLYI